MTIQKPSDLIRFISNIPILNDGTVPINSLESSELFVSDLYEPTYALSALARLTQRTLNSDKIEVVNTPLDSRTIVSKVLNSDLASYSPSIYLLVRVVVLEAFALLYHIEEESSNLQYVSKRDILRIKDNVNYLADYCGTESKYLSLIEPLRDVHLSLGYIENQIDVIMKDKGVR